MLQMIGISLKKFERLGADVDELETTLLASIDPIKPDQSEYDALCKLLLKLGLDLCVPIETRTLIETNVDSIGAGTLIACLDEKITERT